MNALALDLGLKRIGVALCIDEKIAIPLEAILRKNRNQAAMEVKNLLTKYHIKTLLIGVARGGASEGEMQKRVQHFASLLEFDGQIRFVDEGFTSKEALNLRTKSLRQKDGKLDSLAALIMIKDYFGIL